MRTLPSEIRNPKSEIRNKLEFSNGINANDAAPVRSVLNLSRSVIRICFGFRDSDFGFEAKQTLTAAAALVFFLGVFTGCGTTEGGGSSVSGSVYYGAGFYDPWYDGGYYPPDVIVTPPPGRPPAHVELPIAKPPPALAPTPRPLPSIPSTPMPRPAMRR